MTATAGPSSTLQQEIWVHSSCPRSLRLCRHPLHALFVLAAVVEGRLDDRGHMLEVAGIREVVARVPSAVLLEAAPQGDAEVWPVLALIEKHTRVHASLLEDSLWFCIS